MKHEVLYPADRYMDAVVRWSLKHAKRKKRSDAGKPRKKKGKVE